MYCIFDSHSHYDDRAFDEDRETLLSRLFSGDIDKILSCGTTLESSAFNRDLADRYEGLYFAAGIHPECLDACPPDYLPKLKELLAHEKAVAVGEIGLDYTYDIPREGQKRIFEEQLELALELDKPVVVHDREAHADTFDRLMKYRPRGVVHCYSGSVEMAKEYVKAGFYIGVTGIVTFKNARKVVELVDWIPLDRLLIETDAPYLSPVPYRGQRNDSSHLTTVADFIGGRRGLTGEELSGITRENACRLFGIHV